MRTIDALTKAYKDSPVLPDIKKIHELAKADDIAAVNKLLAQYEGHAAISDLADAAKTGFAACTKSADFDQQELVGTLSLLGSVLRLVAASEQ